MSRTKYKDRFWNAAEAHFFLPKAFGAGWTINFYWLFHPAGLMRAHRAK